MKVKIGLFGFGVVGQGFYHILSQKNGTAPGHIERICVRDRFKLRTLPTRLFTYEPSDILDDPEITHVVELIDRPEDAYYIVKTALLRGKTVISANKKMLSDRLSELTALQRTGGGILLYEASACGSIPIIQNLERYYRHDDVRGIQGILNGSTNYILTRMTEEGLMYADALGQAQALGFAETDPALDVDAHDPASKLALLAAHAFGCLVAPKDIFRFGIRTVTRVDVDFATSLGRKIRLIGAASCEHSGKLCAFVLPVLVPPDNPFYNLQNEYNGVLVQSKFMDDQLLTGKGAGKLPTGFAVLGDLTASVQRPATGYTRLLSAREASPDLDRELRIYLRFPNPVMRRLLPDLRVETEDATISGVQLTGRVQLRQLVGVQEALLENGVFLAQYNR